MEQEGIGRLELRIGNTREYLGAGRHLLILGRNPASDIIIDGECVSRSHARLEYRGGRYYLRDESQNGTYIYWYEKGIQSHINHEEIELTSGRGKITLGQDLNKTDTKDVIEFYFLNGSCKEMNDNLFQENLVENKAENKIDYSQEETEIFTKAKPVVKKTLDLHLAYNFLEEYNDRIMVLITNDGFIKYYNYHLERLTRRKYVDFIGQDFFSFIHPEDRQNLLDLITQIGLGIGDKLQIKVRLCTANPRWQAYTFEVSAITPSLQALGLEGIVLLSLLEQSIYLQGGLLSGRYRVVRSLSNSNFCQTYLGEDTQRPDNPRCIIKKLNLLHSDIKVMEVARRLFYQEALSLEILGRHDRIPLLLAYLEDNEYFYIIQDFIEGQSLDQLLTYSWNCLEVVNLMRQVLLILHYVHSQNVIHRDVKPGNIIRRSFDDNYVLIDFGSVKLLPSTIWNKVGDTKSRPLTVVVGTPGYMSPEQSLGKPTKSSDIYSLGIIAIEALLGKSYQSVRYGWVSELEQRNIDKDLIRILEKMVTIEPSKRYQEASEVLIELNYLSLMNVDIEKEFE